MFGKENHAGSWDHHPSQKWTVHIRRLLTSLTLQRLFFDFPLISPHKSTLQLSLSLCTAVDAHAAFSDWCHATEEIYSIMQKPETRSAPTRVGRDKEERKGLTLGL